jgi:hypothetical protein
MPARFVTSGVSSRPGDDEDALPAVRSSGIGSRYNCPPSVIPETGKVSENSAECPQRMFVSSLSHTPRAEFQVAIGSGTEKPPYVLEHDKPRGKRGDGTGDMRPDSGPVSLPQAGPRSGAGHVLAGKASGEDVRAPDRGPVGGRDVAQVRHIRKMVGEDLARAGVDVCHPCELAAEHVMHGQV